MMSQMQARQALKNLATRYLKKDPGLTELINVINDSTRPGLPVRGVLEHIRKFRTVEIAETDKELIEELLYLYG